MLPSTKKWFVEKNLNIKNCHGCLCFTHKTTLFNLRKFSLFATKYSTYILWYRYESGLCEWYEIGFMDWLLCNLVILIRVMQDPILTFRQGSIISEKPGYLSEKFKTLRSPNYHTAWNFLVAFCTFSCLPVSTKGSSGFFYFV